MEPLPKIVQRSLRGPGGTGIHPDPNLLATFAEKSATERERADVLQHLSECRDCREIVRLAMPEVTVAPRQIVKSSTWLSWPVLRWGTLAACVVVVGAAVTLHYDRRQPSAISLTETRSKPPAEVHTSEIASKRSEKTMAESSKPPNIEVDRNSLSASAPSRKQQDHQFVAKGGSASDNKSSLPVSQETLSAQVAESAGKTAHPGFTTDQAQSKATNGGAITSRTRSMEVGALQKAAAPAPAATDSVEPKSKDEVLKKETNEPLPATPNATSLGDRTDKSAEQTAGVAGNYARKKRDDRLVARWTISASGGLLRSLDSGQSWQSVPVTDNTIFRALAANGPDVWTGGAAGTLYHSADAGVHWTQVKPVVNGAPLTADIVSIEFSDPQHGQVTTASHEAWTTSDAGNSWQRH